MTTTYDPTDIHSALQFLGSNVHTGMPCAKRIRQIDRMWSRDGDTSGWSDYWVSETFRVAAKYLEWMRENGIQDAEDAHAEAKDLRRTIEALRRSVEVRSRDHRAAEARIKAGQDTQAALRQEIKDRDAKLKRAQMMLAQCIDSEMEQRDRAGGLYAKMDDAIEALKRIATKLEYFAPARMEAGLGMSFFEEIQAEAGKAAGLPGYH